MKKIKKTENKISQLINNNEITDMVTAKQDQIRDYYQKWIDVKQKEFVGLYTDIEEKLSKKDNHELIIEDLRK